VLLSALDIYVASQGSGTIGEYDASSGATVNAPLISGLNAPAGIVGYGPDLYVENSGAGEIGQYSANGGTENASLISIAAGANAMAFSYGQLFITNSAAGTVAQYDTNSTMSNPALISGLNGPAGIAVTSTDIYVANSTTGVIGQYTTSGATVNASLITGLDDPRQMVVSGSDLFVVESGKGVIDEYTTSGVPVKQSLVANLGDPVGIALFGSDLYVTNNDLGTIGEYTTSGATVNVALVSGLDQPVGIYVAPPPLTLTDPALPTAINVGQSYTITWTGGYSTDTVDIWAEGGPRNVWISLASNLPDLDGSYTWNTTNVLHGWYYFQATDHFATGQSYDVNSPNYLHIVDPAANAPNISLSNPVQAGESVAQGDTYNINFTATDGAGDTNPIFVQLWVYSGDTGQWTVLPNANYLPASQTPYAWNTTGVAPGWYSFAAHATNGDQWSYAASPGWVNVTVPVPTIAFTTPTPGQSVAAGGTFNLDWNITGLSTSDAANSTVQIWAQHLVDGSPVWSEIAASVSASAGTYTWTVPTAPGAGTYYAFSIWLNDGDDWWAQSSPNWLQAT